MGVSMDRGLYRGLAAHRYRISGRVAGLLCCRLIHCEKALKFIDGINLVLYASNRSLAIALEVPSAILVNFCVETKKTVIPRYKKFSL